MRLPKLVDGHPLTTRLKFGFIGMVSRRRVPDIVRILEYRPELWGGPQSQLTQRVMRGDSEWAIGHRELFAAYTSRINHCPF